MVKGAWVKGEWSPALFGFATACSGLAPATGRNGLCSFVCCAFVGCCVVSFVGVLGKASAERVFYSVGRRLIRGRSCNRFGFLWFDLKADVGQRGKDSLGDDSASLEDHSAEFDIALLSPNLDCLHALAVLIRFNEF